MEISVMKYTYLTGRFAMDKILLVLIILLLCLTLPVYCQNNSGNHTMRTTEGNVTSLDWVGSTISVNGIKFSVSSNTDMHKGEDPIGLDSMNVGDSVTVTYYDEPSGIHKTVRIAVRCNGDCAF